MQDEHTLRLYDTALDVAAINKFLVMQDVAVIGSQLDVYKRQAFFDFLKQTILFFDELQI